jgi:DNA-binding PadR family transcriptional regulator
VPTVFSHGRLRLYLLKLLEDGPKHGYELIRLLEDRFLGLYAPSAGTIYPRLARMEAEGQVTHTAAGGRKVYEITESGRAELRHRAAELTALEADIRASVDDLAGLASEIQHEVRGSVRDLKRELREASRQARHGVGLRGAGNGARGASRMPWESATHPDPAAEVDRGLADFTVAIRAAVRAAREAGAEAGTVATAVETTLTEALDNLRRRLR